MLQLRLKTLKHPFKHLKQTNQPVKSHLSASVLQIKKEKEKGGGVPFYGFR